MNKQQQQNNFRHGLWFTVWNDILESRWAFLSPPEFFLLLWINKHSEHGYSQDLSVKEIVSEQDELFISRSPQIAAWDLKARPVRQVLLPGLSVLHGIKSMANRSFAEPSLWSRMKWKETGWGKHRPENNSSCLRVHTVSTIVGCHNGRSRLE